MKPYYQDNHCTIYHGDCREILPKLEPVDLVLTDPPYGIGEDGGNKSRRRNYGIKVNHPKMNWDKKRPNFETFDLILKAGKKQIIWGGNYFADLLPPSMGWLYWDKKMGGDFSDGELAWTSDQRAVRQFCKSPFFQLKGGHLRQHPTQKPEVLMIWCIELAHKRGGSNTILDPFMGSGTTLLAAKNLGRRAIGIELEEKYCEIAAKRLSQEVLPLGDENNSKEEDER